MESFAGIEDYEARYGDVEDPEQVATLLTDATAFIASMPGFAWDADDTLLLANLTRITCAVVHRSLSAGDLAGLQTYSQSAVDYSATVTPYNPAGDFYLTGAEKRTLGIGSGRVAQTWPYDAGRDGGA